MSKYTVKSFSGKFTLVAMNSPRDFFQLPRKIKLTIELHNGRIDEDSKSNLLKLINEIESDIKKDSKLIAPHWYDTKGKVEDVEKEFDTDVPDDKGRIIETRTFPLTSVAELEEFVAYLWSFENEYKHTQTSNIYTPLLNTKAYTALPHEEKGKLVAEKGVVSRACNLLRCCFGY